VLLTRSLAIDHGPEGIRVNCVCPGLIDTEMADWIRHDEEALHRWSATLPAGRMGTPAEIADAVSFLASDRASYLQGSVLMGDGGWGGAGGMGGGGGRRRAGAARKPPARSGVPGGAPPGGAPAGAGPPGAGPPGAGPPGAGPPGAPPAGVAGGARRRASRLVD